MRCYRWRYLSRGPFVCALYDTGFKWRIAGDAEGIHSNSIEPAKSRYVEASQIAVSKCAIYGPFRVLGFFQQLPRRAPDPNVLRSGAVDVSSSVHAHAVRPFFGPGIHGGKQPARTHLSMGQNGKAQIFLVPVAAAYRIFLSGERMSPFGDAILLTAIR